MKKLVKAFLVVSLICFSSSAQGGKSKDDLQDYTTNTDNLWRNGAGAHDGSYKSISASMIGWGVGLAIGIAVLVAVLHQSSSGGGGSHGHCH